MLLLLLKHDAFKSKVAEPTKEATTKGKKRRRKKRRSRSRSRRWRTSSATMYDRQKIKLRK